MLGKYSAFTKTVVECCETQELKGFKKIVDGFISHGDNHWSNGAGDAKLGTDWNHKSQNLGDVIIYVKLRQTLTLQAVDFNVFHIYISALRYSKQ